MLGAIIGDIIGSTFEAENHRSIFFELFRKDARFTDDTVGTFAIAKILNDFIESGETNINKDLASTDLRVSCATFLQRGFGSMFYQWICNGVNKPYDSFGNGALMRISPVCNVGINNGWSLDKIKEVANDLTIITHSNSRALKMVSLYMELLYGIRDIKNKNELNEFLLKKANDNELNILSIEKYRTSITFDLTCETSLSIAIAGMIEAQSFEDVFHLVVSVGGDSDTYCAIAGAMAEVFWLNVHDREKYLDIIKPYFREYDQIILDEVLKNYNILNNANKIMV